MIILGIESATLQVGCALGGQEGVLGSFHAARGRYHAETLTPAIEFTWRQTSASSTSARANSISNMLTAPTPELLTPRELQILRLLAADRTYSEIAAALYLSQNTVKTHIRRLYAKRGVDSRLTAIDKAREWKLLK